MIIGITGPQGSGKTSISDYLGEVLDFKVIHCDEIVHDLLTLDLYNSLMKFFGYDSEKEVNRKKLGALLFKEGNEEALKHYNNLMYYLVSVAIITTIKERKNVIIDWNFLPITDFFQRCDFNILVTSSLDERIKRVMKRDNITYEYALIREKRGIEYDALDYDKVINNENIELEKVGEEVKKLIWN